MTSNTNPFDQITQLPLIGGVAVSVSRHNRRVENLLAKLRELHDDLNAQLYAHPVERPIINCPGDIAQLMLPFMGHLDHEEMWILCLDTRNRVKCLVTLYKGSVNSSQVRVGEVFRQAIIDNSPQIAVVHNHPSGDATPSPDDVAVTRAIIEAGKLLDIEPIDHLIIGGKQWVSLKERGLAFG